VRDAGTDAGAARKILALRREHSATTKIFLRCVEGMSVTCRIRLFRAPAPKRWPPGRLQHSGRTVGMLAVEFVGGD
jgi:hypothetical protein